MRETCPVDPCVQGANSGYPWLDGYTLWALPLSSVLPAIQRLQADPREEAPGGRLWGQSWGMTPRCYDELSGCGALGNRTCISAASLGTDWRVWQSILQFLASGNFPAAQRTWFPARTTSGLCMKYREQNHMEVCRLRSWYTDLQPKIPEALRSRQGGPSWVSKLFQRQDSVSPVPIHFQCLLDESQETIPPPGQQPFLYMVSLFSGWLLLEN